MNSEEKSEPKRTFKITAKECEPRGWYPSVWAKLEYGLEKTYSDERSVLDARHKLTKVAQDPDLKFEIIEVTP